MLACTAVSQGAQAPCSSDVLSNAAKRVASLQEGLRHTQLGEMDTTVPAVARDQLTKLKNALTDAADVALSCADPSVDPAVQDG